MVLAFFGLFAGLSVLSSVVGVLDPLLDLDENQVLYLFSTSAQVVAAIYGLTVTGFVFFRNELSREETEDDTLTEAVESLKSRYLVLLAFISALVLTCLLLSNLAIAQESAGNAWASVTIINTGQSAFIACLLAIGYFVLDVLSPQRIQSESSTLKNELDPLAANEERGDLAVFLRNYNQIEGLLEKFRQNYQRPVAATDGRGARRISNMRVAEILFRSERIDSSLYQEIREIVTLRNSIIHGADPAVSPELVRRSLTVFAKLKAVFEAGGR